MNRKIFFLALSSILIFFLGACARSPHAEDHSPRNLIHHFSDTLERIDPEKVFEEFESSLTWVKRRLLAKDQYFVDDVHPLNLSLKRIVAGAYTNVPPDAAFETRQKPFGVSILASRDKKTIYVSPSKDFARAQMLTCDVDQICLKSVIALKDYFYTGREGNTVHFRYSFINYHSEYINSLAWMYDATGKQEYLDLIYNDLKGIANRLPADGRYLRKLPQESTEPPKYTGMGQALVLLAFNAYFTRVPVGQQDPFLQQVYERAAKEFTHTIEGARNHWTNSMMGLYLAEGKLPSSHVHEMEVFYQQARACGGKIPYLYDDVFSGVCLNFYKPSYVSYDTVLLTRMGRLIPPSYQDTTAWRHWKNLFPSVLEASMEVKKGNIYAARHMEALASAKRLWGISKPALVNDLYQLFLSWRRGPVKNSVDAQARMSMAGPLITY